MLVKLLMVQLAFLAVTPPVLAEGDWFFTSNALNALLYVKLASSMCSYCALGQIVERLNLLCISQSIDHYRRFSSVFGGWK